MSDNDNDDYSESDVEQEYYDDYTIANEHEVHRDTNMPPINILTENDIVGYLQERFRQAENNTLYWHPLMRLIISKYPDLTEMLLGTIELILDIPIQLNIVYETLRLTSMIRRLLFHTIIDFSLMPSISLRSFFPMRTRLSLWLTLDREQDTRSSLIESYISYNRFTTSSMTSIRR